MVLALAAKNLVRGWIGRMWMAMRDMDIAAEIIGIRPLHAKLSAFAVSSFYIGIAGALWAFLRLGSWEPLAFDVNRSFQVLFMIIIGGLGTILGSFLGAAFIVLVPIFLNQLPSWLGIAISTAMISHIEFMLFGAMIVFFLVVEPHGLARLWAIARRSFGCGRSRIEAATIRGHTRARTRSRIPQDRRPGRGRSGAVHGEDGNECKTSVSRCAALLGAGALAAPALAQNEQFIPNLVYRTGAYAPNGIPFANGIADYYKLVNERDGGINGVKIVFEECDTGYATDRGVECYERLKGKGPTGAAYVIPLSTGITFALTEKAPIDKIPHHHHGLRPLGVARRLGVPVEFPAARHLLDRRRHHPAAHRQEGRRVRQAQGQEDRAGLSRLALRQGADRAAAEARADCMASSRCCCR